MNFQMFKLDLEKAEEPEIKLPTSVDHRKSKNSENIFCFIDYAKVSDYVDHNKLWEILQEMGIPDHLSCLLRNLYVDQEVPGSSPSGSREIRRERRHRGGKLIYLEI